MEIHIITVESNNKGIFLYLAKNGKHTTFVSAYPLYAKSLAKDALNVMKKSFDIIGEKYVTKGESALLW